MRAEYLILLGLCVLITLPLEFLLSARVYRQARRLALTLLPTIAVFVAWDYLGIHRGHWWYAEDKIIGVHLPGGMPLEELLFFIVIPICGLLTYEGVNTVLRWLRPRLSRLRTSARTRARDGRHHG